MSVLVARLLCLVVVLAAVNSCKDTLVSAVAGDPAPATDPDVEPSDGVVSRYLQVGLRLSHISPAPDQATSLVEITSKRALPLQLGDQVWYGGQLFIPIEITQGTSDDEPAQFTKLVNLRNGGEACKLQAKPTAWLLSAERKEIEKIGPANIIHLELFNQLWGLDKAPEIKQTTD